jgi:pimeloyl-ACP methyl ester carboxylesterase
LPYDKQTIEFQPDIYRKVWAEAKSMRKSGELVRLVYKIRCPVIVIHGDYDPHPIGGVKKPLFKINKRIKFILLEKCGHYPWYEKRARDEFFSTIYKFLK